MGSELVATIDPGKRRLAIAVWKSSLLQRAFLVEGKDQFATACKAAKKLLGLNFSKAILEEPLVSLRREEDPNDCIAITLTGGLFVGMLNIEELVKVHPGTWMGQRPKGITEQRARKKLSKEELSRIEFPSETKFHADVWDAISIGLWHFRKERRLCAKANDQINTL